MAGDVGELKIGLSFDKSKFKASQDSVEKDTKSWGSKIGGLAMGAGKAVAAGAVAVAGAASAAVVKITKDAVASFAEYQQLEGGVETLFKDTSKIRVCQNTVNFSSSLKVLKSLRIE